MSISIDNGISSDPVFRVVGIVLAILSGVLIGVSFIFKKKGLISSRVEGEEDGHGYLKSAMWWLGMILMALGEITNFIAYALAPAVLVTPLGALSVVVSAVLSSIFLKERLNFHGKLGCAISLLGVIIVVMHAPEQNAPDRIDDFMDLALAPGFLVYTGIIVLGSALLVWKVAPKHGKRHPIVYISICSFIGSLSVCTLQALGGAIIRSISGDNQFTHWFIYLLIIFVVLTIVTQINFLNKALNEFVTSEVTPMYYVVFTTATIVSSAILYQGFNASPVSIVTLIFAFFVICGGVIILQTSRMYEQLRTCEESFMPTPMEKSTAVHMDVTSYPVEVTDLIVPEPRRMAPQKTQTEIEHYTTSPPQEPRPGLKPGPIPPYVSANMRSQSSRSSLRSGVSKQSMLQRIGSVMNPEAFDHLKPRTLFSNEQLEETSTQPLTAATPRPMSMTAMSPTADINRTRRSNTFSEGSPADPGRPVYRTSSNPSVHTQSSRTIFTPTNHLTTDIPTNNNGPFFAINEEPESFITSSRSRLSLSTVKGL